MVQIGFEIYKYFLLFMLISQAVHRNGRIISLSKVVNFSYIIIKERRLFAWVNYASEQKILPYLDENNPLILSIIYNDFDFDDVQDDNFHISFLSFF